MSDNIHSPAHYTVYRIQPIAITRYLGFCLGNAVKYVLRAPYKGGAEDLHKALQYLQWEKETPAPMLPIAAWQKTEEALDILVHHLMSGKGVMPKYNDEIMQTQAEFLQAIGDYLERPSSVGLQHMQQCIRAMLRLLEA